MHPTSCKPSEASLSEPPCPQRLIPEGVASSQQQPEQCHQPQCPPQCRIKGDGLVPFSFFLPTHTKETCKVQFEVKLLAARWDARAATAQHKHAMARGPNQWEKPKGETDLLPKIRAPVEVAGGRCCATWAATESPCLAAFTKTLVRHADSPHWEELTMDITVLAASAAKSSFVFPDAVFGHACINLGNYVPVTGDVTCTHSATFSTEPHPRRFPGFELDVEICVLPHDSERKTSAASDAVDSALGQLEMGPSAPELQFKLEAQQCPFEPGTSIGIAVSPAGPFMPCTLLHGGSLLETCPAEAPNRIGKVTHVRPDASGLCVVRVKADSAIKWRLQSKCSSRCQTSEPQNKVVFCLFPSAQTADEDARQAAEETDLAKNAAAAADAASNILKISEEKLRAHGLASASRPIRITSDQLNKVRLRQCFLLSKPVISGIVRRLKRQWYPEASTTKELFEQEPKSPDDPQEDIYANMKFLLKPATIALLNRSFGCHNPDQECKRQRLEGSLKTILSVRNWWAHVRVVSLGNFREALIALQDFISMVPPSLRAPDCDVLRERLGHILSTLTPNHQIQVEMTMTIDEIAYFYFGQACHFLSELSCHVMKYRPLLTFSALLKQQMDHKNAHFRQKRVVEVKEVTSALIALKESKENLEKETEGQAREDNHFEHRGMDLSFECKTIDIVRNSFAHLSSGGNVIMVVLALGSLTHMFSIVSGLISADVSSPGDGALKNLLERQKMIEEWQAELLGRTGMVDAVFLIDSICKSNHDQLNQCEYAALATDSYRKFRILTTGEVTGSTQASFSSANLHLDDAKHIDKHFRSILDFISVVPADFRQCADSAVRWLMQSVALDTEPCGKNRDMEQRIKNQKWLYDCIKKSFIKLGLPDIDASIRLISKGTEVQKAVLVLKGLREREFTCVIEDISEYIDHLGIRFSDLHLLGNSASGWDLLIEASSVSLNSTYWKKMPCAFLPSFDPCVMGSPGFSAHTPQELFKRCKSVLRPLLHLPPGNHLMNQDGIPGVEACFAQPNYFDALAHLAVLASSFLHSDKQECMRFQRSFRIDVLESDDGQAGLCAIVNPALGGCFGREMENATLNDLIRPVFLSSFTRRHNPIIMVHGQAGTGKSFLVDHVLNSMSNKFQDTKLSIYSHKIQGGLGRAALREGLFKLGLSLCDKLGLEAEASMDDILGSHMKQPRLRNFLRRQRFVIYVDDIDEQGLAELLLHVPKSAQPCCVVLTSISSQIKLISADRFRRLDFIHVELGYFKRNVSLQLVDNVCGSCKHYAPEESFPLRLEIRNWMDKDVFETLADLPLVVRLFAEWLKQELDMSSEDEADFDLSALQERWKQESQQVVNSSVSGNRGLPATIRLLLHNLKSLDTQFKDDAICFLKIMSLSDPNDVNLWSLFDPEVPFLFVPKSWSRNLPQLYLQNNFVETKRKINAMLSPSDPARRIPLLQQLADPKFSFRDFFDRVMQTAPLLTKRDAEKGANKNGPHFIISMHQLIQKAILAQWSSELLESDVILLELLDSRIYNPSKAILPVTNDYYLRIARTAKLMLHNLEDNYSKLQSIVDQPQQNAPFMHSHSSPLAEFIEELRISLRLGKTRIGGRRELGQYWVQSSSLAGLFQKLGLEHESFALVSEVLEDGRFPFVSMETFNRVVTLQEIYSQSLQTCEHSWFYTLRKLQVEVEVEAYSWWYSIDQEGYSMDRQSARIWLQTSKLRMVAPPAPDRQMEHFLTECSRIFCEVRQRVEKGTLEVQEDARQWLERAFVSLGTLSYLLKESDFQEDKGLRTRALATSLEIYEFLKIPNHLREQRAGKVLCAGCDDLLKVKTLIQRYFFDVSRRQETSRRPFRHNVDFLDHSRNWVCKDLAESCLQHALLLPLTPESDRFKILDLAIHWAYESERCANATRAGDDVNVAYRKQLLARCYGARENFKKSLFYHSLALISLRKYHDLRGSRTSREWLDDTQCRMWATLRQQQARQPGVPAVEQYLRWLKDGFTELNAECTEDELKQLRSLDPFDEKYFQSCQSCQRNFDGLLCPRQIDPLLKETLIEHYEILTMLHERKLKGGYFAWHQGIDDICFSSAERQQRRRVFDFFVTRSVLNSDPDLFQCAPEVPELFWQMMLEDLSAPAKCRVSIGKSAVSEWNLFDLNSTIQQRYLLSLSDMKACNDAFEALLDAFEEALSEDRTRRNFFKIAFATREQTWVFRMLQCATFDKRAAIITEMERTTDLQASQHMLKFLFQTTDIKSGQVQKKALDFVFGRKITSYDVLAPLMLICAECNDRRLLMDYWNNGLIEHKDEWPGSDLKNQMDVYFRALNSPNLAWIQLFVLMQPNGQLRWKSVSETRSVGRAKGTAEHSCFVSGVPENTKQADMEHLFRMIGLNCSKVRVKPQKVVPVFKVYFNTSDELDQALTLDQFVLRSGSKPISVELSLVQPPPAMSITAEADPLKCGIGATLECKRTNWEHDRFTYKAGVYISEISPGKGAAAAGLPLRSLLRYVNGQAINMDMELARQLLVGIEGTEVTVDVTFVKTFRNAKSLRYESFQVKRLR